MWQSIMDQWCTHQVIYRFRANGEDKVADELDNEDGDEEGHHGSAAVVG